MVEALDLKKEDPKVVEAYGKGREKAVDDGAPMINEEFLMARRLVEAGVRCVTLAYGRWDYHGNNFGQLRDYLPKLDACLSALVTDIHNRGLDKDVSVVVWGEFGRTPRVNGEAGRDHWPRVSQCLVAGGGMRTGQVIGSTTKDAGEAEDRPIHYKEVMTTLYSRMGIRISETNVPDESGKSHYLFAEQEPIAELV
jgi:uncharacterized protein (DUF1501 family)